MRRVFRGAVLASCAVAAGAAMAVPAEAAIRSGSASDSRDFSTSVGEWTESAIDARRVEVRYDEQLGRMDATVRLKTSLRTRYWGGDFKLSLGSSRAGEPCRADRPGSVHLLNNLSWDMTYDMGADLVDPAGSLVHVLSEPSFAVREEFPNYVFTVQNAALAGLEARCVTGISVGADRVRGFSLRTQG